MPLIQVTNNWDGTQNLLLDGESVLSQKTPEEVAKKRLFLETELLVRTLVEQEKELTPPSVPAIINTGGNTDASEIVDEA